MSEQDKTKKLFDGLERANYLFKEISKKQNKISKSLKSSVSKTKK